MSKSTGSRTSRKAPEKPKKPYAEFPLTPHASGAWMKKIRGRLYYFGRWANWVEGKLVRIPGDNWEVALKMYKDQADDLHAGRTPRVKGKDGLEVKELCNRFLTAKLRKQESGGMSARAFAEYREITDIIVAAFGSNRLVDDLAAGDFETLRATMAKKWGPVRLCNAITRVKSVFKYGMENGFIDRAVRYGTEFRKPDQSALRRHRAKGGEKLFTAEEIRAILDVADPPMKAMILLGINAGLGNNDCSALPLSAVCLETGWLNYPRPKTGIARKCPLWPETVEAIRGAIEKRPKPADYAECGRVFITPEGHTWVRFYGKSNIDKVAVEFGKLVKRLKPASKGLGFYALRHTFRTVADATRDQPAADHIMGHTDPTMRGHYVERIEDDRLLAVVNHVRGWLLQKPTADVSR